VVVIDQIAMVANVVAAEGAVAADAAVAEEAKAEEAKAGIVRAHRRAEHRRALARRLPGPRTRLLRKPHRYRKVTVPIILKTPAMKTLAMRTLAIMRLLKRLASGSRTIVRRRNRSSGQHIRSTGRRNLTTGSRYLHHM
jgi:hypothetical protein